MSKIVSNCEQICHSPMNKSKSKMLFSFSRSSRFPKNKQNECHNFYDLSANIRKRSTCFGYGQKYDFTKQLPSTPPPGTYEKQTIFDEAKKKRKGFGFGSGRGEMEVTGLTPKNSNPGPGAYESASSQGKIAYSLKGKGKIKKSKLLVPGPGNYETYTTFKRKNFLSKHINREGCKFDNCEKLRADDFRIPGPGAYDTSKVEFSPEGRYYLSRFQTAKSRRFGNEKRNTFENRCKSKGWRYVAPGPGNYRLPSEFGYYLSKNILNDSAL